MTRQQLLLQYPVGSRVELIRMVEDPDPIPPGTQGTVTGADDLPSLYVRWDNGRFLDLIPGVDRWRQV